MQELTPHGDLAAFIARIATAPERVLLLDYDGTLAPFHVRPDCAVPYPAVAAVLKEIMQAGTTRVVIVSGRPADEVPPLLGLTPRPEIWGSHGRERLFPDGRRSITAPGAAACRGLDAAAGALEGQLPDAARLERKIASIALHWRAVPPATVQALAAQASACWKSVAGRHDLELLPFDGGLELRAPGCTKAHAVDAVLTETAQAAAVAYLGDDITDEDAFRAVRPRGIGVLVRAQLRETEADVWLRPPEELVAFMRHWCVQAPHSNGQVRD